MKIIILTTKFLHRYSCADPENFLGGGGGGGGAGVQIPRKGSDGKFQHGKNT